MTDLTHLPMRQKIIVMMAVMSGLFLVALDQTIIATALTKIVEDFNSYSSLSWIVTAYLLTTTVTVPISGKLSDLYGRRLLILVGIAIFGVASFLSGSAQNIEQLIGYRALQGIGGGILTSAAFTIIGDLFIPRERGRWQGIIAAVFGSASVIGPLLGGWLTDGQVLFGMATDWRWTFWINIPVAVVSFGLVWRYLPVRKLAGRVRIDYLGAALLTLALGLTIVGVDNTEAIFKDVIEGGVSLTTIRIMIAAIVALLLAAFVWVERRSQEPILPLGLFMNKNFSLLSIIALLNGAAFLGAILYLTQFNQQVFGASASEAGLMLLPLIAGLGIAAAVGGNVVTKIGRYKAILVSGLAITAIGVGALALLTPESNYWFEAALMAFAGVGLGLAMPTMQLAVQNEFASNELGVATASNQMFRSLGSTIGTAVFGALLVAGITNSLAIGSDPYIRQLQQNPQSAALVEDINADKALQLNASEMKEGIRQGAITAIAESPLPPAYREKATQDFIAQQDQYSDRVVQAFSDSLKTVFISASVIMGLAAVLALFVTERKLTQTSRHPEAVH